MHNYLTMIVGPRAGTNFTLRAEGETAIGRDTQCDVVLTDPLCSRLHAVVWRAEGAWWIRDAGSRNGLYVNGRKVEEAQLMEGCGIRVGSTEFSFRQTEHAPIDLRTSELNLTQTIVRDLPMEAHLGVAVFQALEAEGGTNDLILLHQCAVQLLGVSDPDEVEKIGLSLLAERTSASIVGFLWASDDGHLKPKRVIPEDQSQKVRLSDSLTESVYKKGHAVWVDNQTANSDAASLEHYADAICVPLRRESATLGAIHLYLERGRFRQPDFDFALALANLLVVSLVRARQQATLAAEHQRLVDKSGAMGQLIGESKPMKALKSRIARVARATGCVLVRGESGAGKELVAAALHKASPRADRPMRSINCAAIPGTLMESQLFGHVKGAFTGAESDHTGLFQQADSGTLFLDEVGEMTLDGQAKLLRILEGHPFLPVGGTKEITVDVRVIAATNRDLGEFVRERKFREDLYYRLSVFELYIPPLRERGTDIELLVDYFLEHFARQHGRPGLKLAPEARSKLLSYNWPGNVRQLRNVIDSAVVMAEGDLLQPGDLGLRDAGSGELETLKIDHWERRLIGEALSRTGGNVPEAAKLLGIGRATLYRKIEEYGIDR